jgi:hypothetical protein
LPTAGSSLLFFDFTPFEQPLFNGYRIRFQIYTLHGSVDNPAAWKLMLKGTDGLVLVADACREKLPVAQQSVVQLRGVLNSYGLGLDNVPLVLQLNKADRAGRIASSETASLLGLEECDVHLTTATCGDGVLESLTSLSRKIIARIGEQGDVPKMAPDRSEEGAESHADDVLPVTGTIEPALAGMESSPVAMRLSDEAPRNIELADAILLQVKLAGDGVSTEGDTVRIPLEIARPGGVQRLMVTVTVGPG